MISECIHCIVTKRALRWDNQVASRTCNQQTQLPAQQNVVPYGPYRTDKKNKIRKNGDTRGYLFFYRTFFIVIIYTVDWRADLRTHRSKVNAGTIAGPTLCLSIAKQGSPNETDASSRTNDPASTSLSPSSQGADFPPTTSLEARGGKTQKKWEPEKRYRPW